MFFAVTVELPGADIREQSAHTGGELVRAAADIGARGQHVAAHTRRAVVDLVERVVDADQLVAVVLVELVAPQRPPSSLAPHAAVHQLDLVVGGHHALDYHRLDADHGRVRHPLAHPVRLHEQLAFTTRWRWWRRRSQRQREQHCDDEQQQQ